MLLLFVSAAVFAYVQATPQYFCPSFCPTIKQTTVGPLANWYSKAQTETCCPLQFNTCALQNPTSSVCRIVDNGWKIPNETESGVPSCVPPAGVALPPGCQCQPQLNETLVMSICPQELNCCATCNCHGDPHCSSFEFRNKSVEWVVCDARNDQCIQSKEECPKQTWGGRPCVWNTDTPKKPFCTRAVGTPVPQMNMYSKLYKLNGQTYGFEVRLILGVYGSISEVHIHDGDITLIYSVSDKCYSNLAPGHPFNSEDHVLINDLPSEVSIEISCFTGPRVYRRMDVTIIEPSYRFQKNDPENALAGFCPTGKIAEDPNPQPSPCSVTNTRIQDALGCNEATKTCQLKFCVRTAEDFNWPDNVPCVEYVSNPENWLSTLCAWFGAKGTGIPVDPTKCLSNTKCQMCVDSIKDNPDLIRQILDGQVVLPRCGKLKNDGLTRKSLGNQKGMEIQYRTGTTGPWTPVFALLDTEVTICPCYKMEFNYKNPLDRIMLQPGNYRTVQCAGVGVKKPCIGSPGLTISSNYTNYNYLGQATPVGQMYELGKLECNPTAFPFCPPDYQCCIWSSQAAWAQCMLQYHPNYPLDYPKCKPTTE